MKKNFDLWVHSHPAFKKLIMELKIAFLLISISVSTLLANPTYSQTAKVSLDMGKKSVEQVMDEIERQSEFYFIFNQKQVDVGRIVSIQSENQLITAILPELFNGTNVNYVVLDRKILLTTDPLENRLISLATEDEPLLKRITGTVTDQNGAALPGVNVYISGTSQGTATDMAGKYSIEVPDGAKSLMFSFVGMESKEVAIGALTVINVIMTETAIGMDEVVVVGYGVQKKITLTGATSTVKGAQLAQMPNLSLAQTLEGRASGVRVAQGTSITGASARIRLRGASGDPLYVIDDIVVDKEKFDYLTTDEVESISFLKDAATASIYGARAANGVVIIKTKTGAFNQKAKFNYQASANTQFLPLNANDFDFSFDKVKYQIEMEMRAGDIGWTPEEMTWLKANPNFNGWGTAREWLWVNPTGQEHNLSASGGSENISYFASFGYQKSQPGTRAGYYDRYNYRSSIKAKITKTLTLDWISSGYVTESDRPYFRWNGGSGLSESENGWYQHLDYPANQPFGTVIDPATGLGRIAMPSDRDLPGFSHNSSRFTAINGTDGSFMGNNWKNADNKVRLTWDLSRITKGLSVSALGNYSVSMRKYKEYTQYYDFVYPTLANSNNRYVFTSDVSKWAKEHFAINQDIPAMKQTVWNTNSYQANMFVNYIRSFGSHNVSGVMLYEYAGWNSAWEGGSKKSIMVQDVQQLFNFSSNAENTSYDGGQDQYARASFAGRLNYDYKEKYIVQLSWRNDASSLFPSNSRWGFFPSVSGAWRIDGEDFFKVKWISRLKPRFSYGTSGSEGGIGGWQYQNKYQKSTGWEYGSGVLPGIISGVIPNPDITWAKTSEFNVGLDFGVFKNLVTGGIDFFRKENSDLLGVRNQQFPSTWGASLPAVNYAANQVSGIDVFLEHSNDIGDFSYRVAGNVSYAKDKVTKIDENPEVSGTWRSAIGKPIAQIWGYHSLGVIKTQAELDALPSTFTQWGRKPGIGMLLIEDIRGANYSEGPDGKIDDYDYDRLSENGAPRVVFGLALGLSWKGISLDAQFSGVGAFDKMYGQAWGGGSITRNAQVLMERFDPVVNPDGWAPTSRVNYWGQVELGHGPSTTFMFNSSYIRMKNIALSYDFPKQMITRIGLEGLRIFIAGTDLFTITQWFFGDPETQDASSYPRLKTVSAGVNVNF